jgi:hypothetical protein
MKVCFTWYVRLASPAALSCEAAVPGSTIGCATTSFECGMGVRPRSGRRSRIGNDATAKSSATVTRTQRECDVRRREW